MKLPKELTTVTKTSKILAAIVFITLPFLGFFAGTNYQSSLDSTSQTSSPEPILTKRTPTPTLSQTIDTSTWRTYINNQYSLSFKYPANYTITEVSKFDYNPGALKLFSAIIKSNNPTPGGGYPTPHVEIVVYKNDAESLSNWISKYTTSLPFDDPLVSKPDSTFLYRGIKDKKETTLGGKSAITFRSISFESAPEPTLFSWRNHIVGIVLDNKNDVKDPNLKSLYPQILQTFQFIN